MISNRTKNFLTSVHLSTASTWTSARTAITTATANMAATESMHTAKSTATDMGTENRKILKSHLIK